jgi:tetratricopeptide (TPR) repeat protein
MPGAAAVDFNPNHVDERTLRAHLARVVQSPQFATAPKLAKFLTFLVETVLADHGDQIKESLVAVEVYGRRPDYNPQVDSTVRVEAGRLRARLRQYYETAGEGEPIEIDLPKGGYVPVFRERRRSVAESPMASPSRRERVALLHLPFRRWVAASSLLAAGILAAVVLWATTRNTAANYGSSQSLESDALTTRARHLASRRTPETLQRAIMYAGQAVRGTPRDSRGHAVLADAYLSLATFDKSNEQDLVRKSVESSRRSLAFNPSDAASTTLIATVEMERRNWSRAGALFETALSNEPNNWSSHARYARFLSLQGRHGEAIEHAKSAVLHDSLNVPAWASLAQAYMYARDYTSALRTMERGLEIDPAFDNGHLLCARLNILLMNLPDAGRHLSSVSAPGQRRPEHTVAKAWLLARQGCLAEALAAVRSAAGASSIGIATAYATLGQHDAAFKVLRAAVETGERDMIYLKVSPGLDPLRSDPRLDSLCDQVRLHGCTQTP